MVIQPVPISFIGTPMSKAPIVVQTPDHEPNLVVTVITPIVITASDFLHLLCKCAGLAVCGATLGLIKDIITISNRLEGKFPLLTGSI